MTISRSKAVDAIGTALLLVGLLGFSGCWVIGWNAQERILTTNQFDRATATTPASVELKGRTFFVEPDYARRFASPKI
jgi:hypothetical protein